MWHVWSDKVSACNTLNWFHYMDVLIEVSWPGESQRQVAGCCSRCLVCLSHSLLVAECACALLRRLLAPVAENVPAALGQRGTERWHRTLTGEKSLDTDTVTVHYMTDTRHWGQANHTHDSKSIFIGQMFWMSCFSKFTKFLFHLFTILLTEGIRIFSSSTGHTHCSSRQASIINNNNLLQRHFRIWVLELHPK